MPTYDYECSACGHKFEEYQSIKAKPLRKCPACAKNTVKRLIGTGAGIIFKGSGFYQTDYRSESYKAGAKAESDRSSAAAKTGDAATAAKSSDSTAKPASTSASTTSSASGNGNGSTKSGGTARRKKSD